MKTPKMICIVVVVLFISYCSVSMAQHFPFPQHVMYAEGHIKPDNYTQVQLDEEVKTFYDYWKANFVDPSCENGRYFVKFAELENVSEGLGYGMMIVAYLAGYDSDAKNIFDGMYHFYKDFPSQNNPKLMAWKQRNCQSVEGPNSATDGDLDIAFSLLLAHTQWGSNGAIDYLTEARNMIKAIHQDDLYLETQTIKLGDWVNSSNPNFYYATRSSDQMTSHLRSFGHAGDHLKWKRIADTCYSVIEHIQTGYSPNTGLVPDFIVHVNTNPQPAPPNFIEKSEDGDYYYNACRFPWRLGADFLLFGDDRARIAVNKILTWLKTACNNDPNQISSGYKLDGTKLHDWNDAAFIGPFTVGAMVSSEHQDFLNSLYDRLLSLGTAGGYYNCSIKMCNLIIISGNNWAPDSSSYFSAIDEYRMKRNLFSLRPTVAKDVIQLVMDKPDNITNTTLTIINTAGKKSNQ